MTEHRDERSLGDHLLGFLPSRRRLLGAAGLGAAGLALGAGALTGSSATAPPRPGGARPRGPAPRRAPHPP
ncbi:hypothetical protein ACFXB3_19725, partial [Streptomyces sp. NPDC059447]